MCNKLKYTKLKFGITRIFLGFFAVLLVGFAFAITASSETASAVEATNTSKINAIVHDYLAIGISADGVQFSLVPTPSGHFDSKKTQVKVYTNSDGYKLYLSSKTTDLDLTQTGVTEKLANLTSDVAIDALGTEFPINSWGYSLNNIDYTGISTTPVLLKTQTGYLTERKNASNEVIAKAGEDTVDIYFGAKATTAMPSGAYTNTVVLTAEATVATPNAPAISGETDWVNSATIEASTPASSKFNVKEYEFFVTGDATIDPNSEEVTATGRGDKLVMNRDTGYTSGHYYVFFRAVDYTGTKSAWSNQVHIKLDVDNPTINLVAKTNNTGATQQTATLTCGDNIETTKYYWGNKENPEDGEFVSAAAATSWTTDKTITIAGKYNLICMDEAGNRSDLRDLSYYSYSTVTLLDTTDGTSGNYIRANYVSYQNGANYIAPAGTMIQPSDFYIVPTPESDAANYKGASIIYDVTTEAVLTKTPLELTKDSTFYAWFDRNTYTLKLNRKTGVANIEGEGTYKYGATANIKATMSDGFGWQEWEVISGNTPADLTAQQTTVVITQDTELTAKTGDAQRPVVQKVERKTHDSFELTITDNVAVQKYCVTTTAGKPASTDACWQNADNSTSFTTTKTGINSADTWYVWGMDDTGNITDTDKMKSITSYEVTRVTSNAALTTKWEGDSGTSFTDATSYALAGTPIYVFASTLNGYDVLELKWFDNGTHDTSFNNGDTKNVSTTTKIDAKGVDTEAPVVSKIERKTYNTFELTITDNVGVAEYCVNNSADTTGCTWKTANNGKTFTTTETITATETTWYVWGKDAAGKETVLAGSKNIDSYKVYRTVANATLTTKYESSTGTAFSGDTYVLKDTPIYVEATVATGYPVLTLTFAGDPISSGDVKNVERQTEIKATAEDNVAPVTSISTTANPEQTSQTVTLGCTDDGTKVEKYYFGTSDSPSDGDFQLVAGGPLQTFSKTETVSAAGTYYLFCRDVAGNTNTNKDNTNTLTFYTYQTKAVLDKVDKDETHRNNVNYEEVSGKATSAFIIPKGTSIQPGTSSIITTILPTESIAANYKGYSTDFNGTDQTPVTGNYTINGNTTFYAWFERSKFSVALSNGTGIASTTGSGTYKYGANVSIDATVSNGFTWKQWNKSGSSWSTTKNATISNITENWALTAEAEDKDGPKVTITGRSDYRTITFDVEDQGSGVAAYCVQIGNTKPTAAQCKSSGSTAGVTSKPKTYSGSIQIGSQSSDADWYVFAVDGMDNVTPVDANLGSIRSVRVTPSVDSNTNTDLFTCYDSTAGCTTSNFTAATWMLEGTNVYARATGKTNLTGYVGYTVNALNWTPTGESAQTMNASSDYNTGGYKTVGDKDVTISATSSDVTKPVVTAISRDTTAGVYQKFNFTIKDGVGVTAWCVTKTNSAAGCSWNTVSSQTTYNGSYTISDSDVSDSVASVDYYVWGRDAAGNVTDAATTTNRTIKAYRVTMQDETNDNSKKGGAPITAYMGYSASNSSATTITTTNDTKITKAVVSGAPVYFSTAPTNNSTVAFSLEKLAHDGTNVYNVSATTPQQYYTQSVSAALAMSSKAHLTTLASKTTDLSGTQKNDVVFMQQVSSPICNQTTANNDTVYYLIDNRINYGSNDKYSYRVKKLTDNHCWMNQNLALKGQTTLTPTYSNLPHSNVATSYTLPVSDFENSFFTSSQPTMYNGTHVDNTVDNSSSNMGAYYSYEAASTNKNLSTRYSNTPSDICPAGWRLPMAYSGNDTKVEAYDLVVNSVDLLKTPWNNGKTGYLIDGIVGDPRAGYTSLGDFGEWWTSTISGYAWAYAYSAWNDRASYGYSVSQGDDKRCGFSVRCLVK